MFYSQLILAKKGELGKIWLAAHMAKKLSKKDIFKIKIEEYVQKVIFPNEPLSLRVSGHLLLGIVRIYASKVDYLVNDYSEALIKIKLAFRSADVDLPIGEQQGTSHAINAPGFNRSMTSFDDVDLDFIDENDEGDVLADLQFLGNEFQTITNQANDRDITMASSFANSPYGGGNAQMMLGNSMVSYGGDNISFQDGDSILGSTRKSQLGVQQRSPTGGIIPGPGGVVADSFGSVSDVELGRAAQNASGFGYSNTNMDNIPMDTSFTSAANNRQSLGQSGFGNDDGGFDDDFGNNNNDSFGQIDSPSGFQDGLRKKEIHNFDKDGSGNVLGVQFDAFNLEDGNDVEEQLREKKKRKKNNLSNLYAKALKMDRDDGSLEMEEYKDPENGWESMKRKRKEELVERGPVVEDEAITTINIPRYLNETKQEYSDRIKLRIKLAAIALRKRRRIFSSKKFLSGPSTGTSMHNEVTKMYETIENKKFSVAKNMKTSSLSPLPPRDGSSSVGGNNMSSFDVEGGRAGDDSMFDDNFDGGGFDDDNNVSYNNRLSLGNNNNNASNMGGMDQSFDNGGFGLNASTTNNNNLFGGDDDDAIDENASRRPSSRVKQDIRSHVLEPKMVLMMDNLKNNATVLSSDSDEEDKSDQLDPFADKNSDNVVNFNDIVKGSTKSQAAKCFFDLLVLKTRNEIKIKQEDRPEGYGPIKVALVKP